MARQHEHRTNFKTLKSAAKLIWPEIDSMVKRRLVLTLLMVLSTSALATLSPVIFAMLVDGFTTGNWKSIDLGFSLNHLSEQTNTVMIIGPTMLVIAYAFSQWLNRAMGEIRSVVYGTADARLNRRLSGKLFSHIMRLPLRYHLDRKSGALNQTLVQGLNGYRMLLQLAISTIVPVLMQIIIIGGVLFYLQPMFLVILGFSAIAYTFTFSRGAAQISGPSRELSAKQIESHGVMTDSFLNYETVKYFTGEQFIGNRYDNALLQTEQKWGIFYRRKMVNGIALGVIFSLSLGTANWIASQQLLQGAMSVGALVLVNTYMMQIIGPLEQLGGAFKSLAQGVSYMEKMIEIFEQTPEAALPPPASDTGLSRKNIHQAAQTVNFSDTSDNKHYALNNIYTGDFNNASNNTPDKARGELSFSHVNFSYHSNRPILKDVSFKVAAGKTLAIVGPSGSGKSTLVRLLVRLYEADSGQICLNGESIMNIPLLDLRQSIAVVPQDTVLFNDTLKYNIGFGKPGSDQAEIVKAAKLAHIDQFIDSLPDKYLTTVGERGLKLSGGEKQRISIARAVLKNPQIFIFDEATSSLDTHTEREIQNNLMEISKGSTTLIVAHRLSTVVHADEILVLNKGEITERGTHNALMERDGAYASMWKTQHQSKKKVVV